LREGVLPMRIDIIRIGFFLSVQRQASTRK